MYFVLHFAYFETCGLLPVELEILFTVVHEILSHKMSEDVSKDRARLKTHEKRTERPRIVQLNNMDVFESPFFTGDESKTDKGRTREIKLHEMGEQGTGSRNSRSPPPPPPPQPHPALGCMLQCN